MPATCRQLIVPCVNPALVLRNNRTYPNASATPPRALRSPLPLPRRRCLLQHRPLPVRLEPQLAVVVARPRALGLQTPAPLPGQLRLAEEHGPPRESAPAGPAAGEERGAVAGRVNMAADDDAADGGEVEGDRGHAGVQEADALREEAVDVAVGRGGRRRRGGADEGEVEVGVLVHGGPCGRLRRPSRRGSLG